MGRNGDETSGRTSFHTEIEFLAGNVAAHGSHGLSVEAGEDVEIAGMSTNGAESCWILYI